MTQNVHDVSVIICAYTEKRWDDLVRAVQSVRDQQVAAREIIVVVDHNSALFQRVRNTLHDVVVVENTQQRGLGGARNSGVAAATSAIVAFLDDDAAALPDWISNMCVAYRDDRVLGVGGDIEPDWECGRPSWFPSEFHWVVGCSYTGMPRRPAPVRNLFGANMSFRRDVFRTVNMFRLGYGCDETEFCIRVHTAFPDAVLLYDPAVRIRHRVSGTRATFRYFLRRCFFEGGSKAAVTWLVGADAGLSNERTYTMRVLPHGAAMGVLDLVRRGDAAGFLRACSIGIGLLATTTGYVLGKLSSARAARKRGWAPHLEEVPL